MSEYLFRYIYVLTFLHNDATLFLMVLMSHNQALGLMVKTYRNKVLYQQENGNPLYVLSHWTVQVECMEVLQYSTFRGCLSSCHISDGTQHYTHQAATAFKSWDLLAVFLINWNYMQQTIVTIFKPTPLYSYEACMLYCFFAEYSGSLQHQVPPADPWNHMGWQNTPVQILQWGDCIST